jgi:hypothetical protein
VSHPALRWTETCQGGYARSVRTNQVGLSKTVSLSTPVESLQLGLGDLLQLEKHRHYHPKRTYSLRSQSGKLTG